MATSSGGKFQTDPLLDQPSSNDQDRSRRRRPIGISTAFAGSDKYGSNASLIELAELLP
jgi:hypothetical protein